MHSVYVSIDVEDWFQVENLRPAFPMSVWDQQEWRVEANVDRILNVLEEHNAQATFFILGCIAEEFPQLVKQISKLGYEVGSHGYNHELLTVMSSSELVQDLETSKKLLEDLSGKKVKGYRAPSFSVNDENIHLIKEAGYLYDSSFNDFGKHDRYGSMSLEGWKEVHPGVFQDPEDEFYELPIQNLKTLGVNIPWAGGGYFRILPWNVFKMGIQRIIIDKPYIFYLHPWEVDANQPTVKNIPFTSRFRHYFNLSKVEGRLSKLLESFTPKYTLSSLISQSF